MNCNDVPAAICEAAGVTLIDTSVALEMFSVAVPEINDAGSVAVIVTLPVFLAEATAFFLGALLIDAVLFADELHDTYCVMSRVLESLYVAVAV